MFWNCSRGPWLLDCANKPGALAIIAKRLRDDDIDVRSMHLLRRDGGTSLASLVCTDNMRAASVLADMVVSV